MEHKNIRDLMHMGSNKDNTFKMIFTYSRSMAFGSNNKLQK